ncbi:hypothetical protein ACSU1N_03990 [Thermogladius sp. 4427co]|uniref:hypothetical protein n=1 Tax=Thermogladius sp. 4427co TaxID=3450718 RepID=UPI003F79F084
MRMEPLFLPVLAILVVASSMLSYADGYGSVLLNASRPAVFYGTIEFKSLTSGTISLQDGSIRVPAGTTIRIVVNDVDGYFKLWIGSDGWVDASDIYVTGLYLNGTLTAQNTVIKVKNIQADLATLYSTLAVEVSPQTSGWTQLIYNGQTIIPGVESSDHIVVKGLAADTSKALNIDGSGSRIYVEGLCQAVYVNGSEVPKVGSVFIATPIILLALAYPVYRLFKSRKNF